MVNLSSDLPATPEGSLSPPVCCERAPLDDDDLDHQSGGDGDDHDENDTDDDGTFLQASWQFMMWER